MSEKQIFQKNVYLPLIQSKGKITLQQTENTGFEHKIQSLLNHNKIDKAIEELDNEINDQNQSDPNSQLIVKAFKATSLYKDTLKNQNGILYLDEKTFDLNDDQDIMSYLHREISTRDDTFDPQVEKVDHNELMLSNRRQIRYLFSHLIEKKFEQKMESSEYEKLIEIEEMTK